MCETPQKVGGIGTEDQRGLFDSSDREENVFGTTGNATDYFVAAGYRPGQREAIDEIEHAFEQGYRFVILDAPTGSGKSHIARALAFQSARAHIVTVQKILQDQYENDFADMVIMKGRSAYDCLADLDVTCADGPCTRRKGAPKCEGCKYQNAYNEALGAPVTVHNFDSFFYQNSFGKGHAGRKLLIVDEAHNIESKYSEFMSFVLTDKILGKPIPEYQRIEEYDDFLKKAYDDLMLDAAVLNLAYEEGTLGRDEIKQLEKIQNLARRIFNYLKDRERPEPLEYVFDYEVVKGAQHLKFRPVMVGDFVQNTLYKYGDRVLLMSATILDKRMFCESAGIDPKDAMYIEVPSHFPAENRPIVRSYVGLMTFKHIDKNLPHMVEAIERLLEKHRDRKGIIQTHSEKIADFIREWIEDDRLTFNKDFPDPQSMLMAHRVKYGSFIVASGLREGLDLRGDLSKIQILCKVPYPSLGDKRVKRRMELNNDWYGYQTVLMFVQILGRSVRSATDKAITYILDSNFGYFYKRNSRFIPEYVKRAIDWSKDGKA